MKSNFNDCLNRVLKHEGGYGNDPQDPGGPTNYGITIYDVRMYVKKGATAQDVKNLTLDQAKDIYKTKYWDALNCDSLPSGVDYTCFDYGVNSGLGRPRKDLNRFKSFTGVKLIDAINDERTEFLRSLSTFPRFGKGWMRRVNDVRSYSHVLASKKADVTTGPAVGTATVGFGAALSQYVHVHQTAIIIGAVIVAVVIGTAIHYFKNRK